MYIENTFKAMLELEHGGSDDQQTSELRNLIRRADVNTILSAVYQYTIDNGFSPNSITTTSTEICSSLAEDCTGLVDLSVLTDNEEYLFSIPPDPI